MTPQNFIQSIVDQNLGDTVFIIGGGPSLMKYMPDPNVLRNKNVIATNNAYQLYPWAICTHFADKIWWQWHKDKLEAQYKGPICTCMVNTNNHKEFAANNITIFMHGNRHKDITGDKGKLNGNNAGHQAINLAYHLGFKKIILLGFDMSPTNKQTHWHNDHQRSTNLGLYSGSMIPGMETIPKFEQQCGFKVYNVNHDSAIRCFEFTDIKEWI